jgi:pimeloyl-ACP methyl ester carboxylesterase
VSLDSAQKLRQCFDRVEFELLPGTGHLPYEECPEVLARLVNSFLIRMRQTETGPQLVRNQTFAG